MQSRSLTVLSAPPASAVGAQPDAPRAKPARPARHRVVMVYPHQGFSGVFIEHMPLSLLYASIELVKGAIDVSLVDNRLHPQDWREVLRRQLSPETLVVGISVMSGRPIVNAIEVSRFVKSIDPAIKVVWGGPHATFAPETIFDEPSVDYVVSGYGSKSFHHLVTTLMHGGDLALVRGLSYREHGAIARIPEVKEFESIDYREIPYHLIPDHRRYGQMDTGRVVFSMYSVHGCPYKCTFCSSPAQYKGIPGKAWVPLEVQDVVDHVQHVVETYGANYIYFIDDDSFPKLSHVEGIIDEIRRRGLKVKLGFRGARINEIKRMSHAFLSKLAEAGTDIIHIGAESGSDRILKLIKKDCTVEDILECNRKLAQHPEISVGYNFMMGLPSETMEEVRATRDLWLKIVEDNPRAIIFHPNKFRPLPGTELYDYAAREWGYQPPKTLDEWANMEVEADYAFPWYPEGMEEFCNLLLVSSYFIDGKIFKFTEGRTPLYKALRAMSAAYAPVARWRLVNGYDRFLVEYPVYRVAQELLLRLKNDPSPMWGRLRRWVAPEFARGLLAETESC
jgi:anaerobic magnesium-protoporphyrin IX monomethyl ester cyclase